MRRTVKSTPHPILSPKQSLSLPHFLTHKSPMGSLSGAAEEIPAVNGQLTVALVHNPGLAMTWTRQEQATLEEGLRRYPSDLRVNRYAKIANGLPNKTIRDVALRCRWMAEKNMGPFARSSNPLAREISNHDGIANYERMLLSAAIVGDIGKLLEQNSQAFQRPASQVEENNALLQKTRENIVQLLRCVSNVPMGRDPMPPLPVTYNEELANAILFNGMVHM